MTLSWFCVRTKPRREGRAETELQALGLTVYLPREALSVVRQRGIKRVRAEIVQPLIPRHLFVGLNRHTAPWRAINEADSVERLLTAERRGEPSEVPWRAIAVLQVVEGELKDEYERRKARAENRFLRQTKIEPDEVIAALKKAEPSERADIILAYAKEHQARVTLKLGDLKAVVENRVVNP
jgi:hypothetical protein